jgi:hypothetical protein
MSQSSDSIPQSHRAKLRVSSRCETWGPQSTRSRNRAPEAPVRERSRALWIQSIRQPGRIDRFRRRKRTQRIRQPGGIDRFRRRKRIRRIRQLVVRLTGARPIALDAGVAAGRASVGVGLPLGRIARRRHTANSGIAKPANRKVILGAERGAGVHAFDRIASSLRHRRSRARGAATHAHAKGRRENGNQEQMRNLGHFDDSIEGCGKINRRFAA